MGTSTLATISKKSNEEVVPRRSLSPFIPTGIVSATMSFCPKDCDKTAQGKRRNASGGAPPWGHGTTTGTL